MAFLWAINTWSLPSLDEWACENWFCIYQLFDYLSILHCVVIHMWDKRHWREGIMVVGDWVFQLLTNDNHTFLYFRVNTSLYMRCLMLTRRNLLRITSCLISLCPLCFSPQVSVCAGRYPTTRKYLEWVKNKKFRPKERSAENSRQSSLILFDIHLDIFIVRQ